VWAPAAESVDVHLVAPADRLERLSPKRGGYFAGDVDGIGPRARYLLRLDSAREFPDPASRWQPEGVHGPSAIPADDFPWTDTAWRGRSLEDLVIYELHVGTFTPEGTFDGVVEHLGGLRDLGVTAIELMPVAPFPGTRNWGYDGVSLFAVQESYGGPTGLRRLVDAAHGAGLAVLLDVVYNHLGPEGNYLDQFGPYFTDRYRTPWGPAVNFDGPGSEAVRRFFVENAVQWVRDFRLDGLRLDAIHSIFDGSARHVLAELAAAARAAAPDRPVHVIGESNANDVRVITPEREGGYGLDAQWSDDFHHALHVLLTSEREGYYEDFGTLAQLATAYEEGFVYSGQYSRYRRRPHGTSSRACPATRFVISAQNHDQIGNRRLGERLSQLVSREQLKLAAGALVLSPCVPLLFMGEEYGEVAPFLYFVSHSDPALVKAVRDGRRREFAAFGWQGEVPDPQAEETFRRSTLGHSLKEKPGHRALLEFHIELLRLRRSVAALRTLDKTRCEVTCLDEAGVIALRRWAAGSEVLVVLSFRQEPGSIELAAPDGRWRAVLDSADARWMGAGRSAPEMVVSAGSLTIPVRPAQVLVLLREG
jgi:maltooligosyltrehalose trehalohydrolase